jgi:hypothetical protein
VDWYDEDLDEDADRYEPVHALEEDAVEREVALVALEAAALSRRIFPPARRLTIHGQQALLALALVDHEEGLSAGLLGNVLALDHEEALEALSELLALGLAQSVEPLELVEIEEEASYGLTASGAAAAREVATAARRHLPGWPPR